eukprot:c13063_g1_i3.p1 GENE.c13063_g1_i3~~c13063_g1_i3.p1  ORF type:complete len:1028 (-),score=286.97 c13063_g1_i3:82-3165(-)
MSRHKCVALIQPFATNEELARFKSGKDLVAKVQNVQSKNVREDTHTKCVEKPSRGRQNTIDVLNSADVEQHSTNVSVNQVDLENVLMERLRWGLATCQYVKVTLGGEGRAGKTTTQRNLLGKEFKLDTESTNGIQITPALMTDEGFLEKELLGSILTKQGVLSAVVVAADTSPSAAPPASTLCGSEPLESKSNTTTTTSSTLTDTPAPQTLDASQIDVEVAKHFFLGKSLLEDEEVKSALADNNYERKMDGSITALFYDCGGQNIYQTANELFFTPRSVVVLVFNMQEIIQDQSRAINILKGWCQSISLHARDSPIILVGTRADQMQAVKDQKSISEILKNNIGKLAAWKRIVDNDKELVFVPVNNINGPADQGIVALRKLILKVTKSQRFYEEKFPVRWLQCLDLILGLNDEPIMSLKHFTTQIAGPCGVNEASEVRAMCKQLHDLGFVVCYDDVKFKDWIITNPQKIIDAVACVITTPAYLTKLKVNHETLLMRYLETGQLDILLLRELWAKANVTANLEHQNALIWLMEKFDLICELEKEKSLNDDRCFIVPSMLQPSGENPLPNVRHIARVCFVHKDSKEPALPPGVYYRLVTKCVRWSQLTSNYPGSLDLHSAVLKFGHWKVKLVHDRGSKDGRIQFYFESPHAGHVIDLIHMLIGEVIFEAFPHLAFVTEIAVGDPPQWIDLEQVRASRKGIIVTDNHGNTIPSDKFKDWLIAASVSRDMAYDLFLSYRVATDKLRVKVVYDCVSLLAVDDQGTPPTVFFDSECLLTGQKWNEGFAQALANSSVFMPLISLESVESIRQKSMNQDDNVMLEWSLALELMRKQRVKAIIPFFLSNSIAFTEISNLPDHVNSNVNMACIKMLTEVCGVHLSDHDNNRIANQTVRSVGEEMCRLQGVRLAEDIATDNGRVNWGLFKTCTSALRLVLKDHHRVTVAVPTTDSSSTTMMAASSTADVLFDWLKEIKMEQHIAFFNASGIDDFETLFGFLGDNLTDFEELAKEMGLTNIAKIAFKNKVFAKKAKLGM